MTRLSTTVRDRDFSHLPASAETRAAMVELTLWRCAPSRTRCARAPVLVRAYVRVRACACMRACARRRARPVRIVPPCRGAPELRAPVMHTQSPWLRQSRRTVAVASWVLRCKRVTLLRARYAAGPAGPVDSPTGRIGRPSTHCGGPTSAAGHGYRAGGRTARVASSSRPPHPSADAESDAGTCTSRSWADSHPWVRTHGM